ncbi:MAG: hypothetical protein CVV41_04510 [Candidatus Riflebacteria bacterium HGW-Riflebacteria-1]|nr:MAG: hypothetical protein CVV41_04510 [Candidatus Riflebacteria bacterium HGW-Riflebacteria-1]
MLIASAELKITQKGIKTLSELTANLQNIASPLSVQNGTKLTKGLNSDVLLVLSEAVLVINEVVIVIEKSTAQIDYD